MTKFILPAVYALLCASCSTAGADKIQYGQQVPIDSDFRSAVEAELGRQLRDPYSAVYGPMRSIGRVRNGDQELVICGYVNAKNGFGGYNGMQPYVAVYNRRVSRLDLVTMGDQSELAALHVKSVCSAAGIPI